MSTIRQVMLRGIIRHATDPNMVLTYDLQATDGQTVTDQHSITVTWSTYLERGTSALVRIMGTLLANYATR